MKGLTAMIRVLIRYETSNYKLPTNDNLSLMQFILDKQIEEFLEYNQNIIFEDLAGTKITVAKIDGN